MKIFQTILKIIELNKKKKGKDRRKLRHAPAKRGCTRDFNQGNFGGYGGSYQNGYGGVNDLGFKEKYEQAANVLGVTVNTDIYEVKLAYRKLAKKYHPDLNKEAGAKEKFQEINDAYEFLSEENIKKYKNNYL